MAKKPDGLPKAVVARLLQLLRDADGLGDVVETLRRERPDDLATIRPWLASLAAQNDTMGRRAADLLAQLDAGLESSRLPSSDGPTTMICPLEIEDQICAALDGGESELDARIEALQRRHPEHCEAIRAWIDEYVTPPGDRYGPFRIGREIGRGGMGVVYEAVDSRTGHRVAVKVLAPRLGLDRRAQQRFRQEGRLAAAIHHPRCVFVVQAGFRYGRPFVAMELMPGRTLADLVKERGPLPIAMALGHIRDVIDGLIPAHDLGVIHRDVKPGNCFLDADGRSKIGDFGLSRTLEMDSALTGEGFVGTPLFAPPEQLRGGRLDERCDVYSLGATLWFLLAGRPPFDANTHEELVDRIAVGPPPSVRAARSDVPRGLDAVVRRAMETDRDLRFRDLRELRQALGELGLPPFDLAPRGHRAMAMVIDAVPSFPALYVFHHAGFGTWTAPFSLLLILLYGLVAHRFFGGTMGYRLLRMRVCSTIGRGPTVAAHILRGVFAGGLVLAPLYCAEAVPALSGWVIPELLSTRVFVAIVGVIVLLGPAWFGPGRVLLHDRLTRTVVARMESTASRPRIAAEPLRAGVSERLAEPAAGPALLMFMRPQLPAGLGALRRRAVALLVDGVLAVPVWYLAQFLGMGSWSLPLAAFAWACYGVVAHGSGGTLGYRFMGLQVRAESPRASMSVLGRGRSWVPGARIRRVGRQGAGCSA